MKTKQVTRSRGQKWIAPVLVFALLAVMIFPVAATLVYPTVTLNPISYHTVGDTVTFTATSTLPCWRMAAKYEHNGTTTWLTDVYSNYGQWSFTVNSVGYYTVTVYARSYEPSDPRSANSGSSPMTFYVYPEHEHSYATTYSYDYSHPHRAYYECTNDVGICDAEKLYVNAYYNGNYPYCTATTGSITKIWCKNDGNNTQLQDSSSELVHFCNTYTETVTDDTTFPDYRFSYSLVTDANGSAVQSSSRTRSVTITSGSISPQCLYGYVRYQFDKYVALDYMGLSMTELELLEGETYTLTKIPYPRNATNKSCTWQTSDSSVATVSSTGVVTAVGPGTAIISAVPNESGVLYDTCLVTVYAYEASVQNYYDYAFGTRYGGDTVAASTIINVMRTTADIYNSLFGLRLEYTSGTKFKSLSDACFLDRNPSITEYLDEQCTIHSPSCTGWTRAHYAFAASHPGDNKQVTVLWTGKKLFGDNANRGYYISTYKSISIQKLHSVENVYQKHLETFVHEFAHFIGAPDHYCKPDASAINGCKSYPICSECGDDENMRPKTCQMYALGRATSSNVFCGSCKTDITDHLNDHH